MLTQSMKQKSKEHQLTKMTDFSDSYSFSFLIDSSGLPLGTSYQKSGSTSYGAYGIAKNNKMSDVSVLSLKDEADYVQ